MQSAFFKLNEHLMPYDRAVELMKDYAKASYARHGEAVLKLNYDAIDAGGKHVQKVEVKPEWKNLKVDEELKEIKGKTTFVKKIADVVNRLEGDTLPVSSFEGYEDGHLELGTSAFEKRGVANFVPEWDEKKCIQCNLCVFACPHAVIRAFLVDEEEAANIPENSNRDQDKDILIPARGKGLEQYQFTIQVSALDCTDCRFVLMCVQLMHLKWFQSVKNLQKAHKKQLITSLTKLHIKILALTMLKTLTLINHYLNLVALVLDVEKLHTLKR